MATREVLLLGNPELYEISDPIGKQELGQIKELASDLHDTLMDFRKRWGVGRAIAAPQIGVMKRLIYMNTGLPAVLINPVLDQQSQDTMELWDDCMCFPDLLVRVRRCKSCRIRYCNLDWDEEEMHLGDDLSELLQHEYDHLDGILAVSRAVDGHSFALRSQRQFPGGSGTGA